MSRVQSDTSILVIIVPLLNLIFLILIEYLMMEKSRKEYGIEDFDIYELLNFVDKKDLRTNQYSLLSIFSTLYVFLVFMYLLIF